MRFQSRFRAFSPFAICAAQGNSAYCVHWLPSWEVIVKYYPSPKDKTARQELNLRSCFLILTDRNYFFSYLVVFIKTIISLCSVKWWIFTSLLCSLVNFLHISHLLRWITVDCILMDLHQSHLRPRRIEEKDYKHSLSSIRPGSD